MKRISRKFITVSVLLVIAILIAIIIYQNYSFMKEKERMLDEFRDATSYNLMRLNDNIGLVHYLLENNASTDTIKQALYSMMDNAYTLSSVYLRLYGFTKDIKFWRWHVIFDNIFVYASDLVGDMPQDMLNKLRESAETLKELYSLLKSIRREYGNDLHLVPDEKIDQIKSLTEKLVKQQILS